MWKILSVFTLLVLAQAADIDDIYGDWWQVAFYPAPTYGPPVSIYGSECRRFRFAKCAKEVNCTYADGRNASLVLATIMTDEGLIERRQNVSMVMVNTPAEVIPALNISVKCDGEDMRDRAVVRLVNQDYFIVYPNTRKEVEPNPGLLFGRNLVSSEQLSAVMLTIEDFKNRRGAQMCGTENYGGLKSTENEIKN